jgi:hypothetical protein
MPRFYKTQSYRKYDQILTLIIKGSILMCSENFLFGIDKLTSQRTEEACPVIGCNENTKSGGKFPICCKHGLEIHKSTFIYYNGDSREDKKKAALRNFLPFKKDFVAKHIIGNPYKAESFRLGSENSEDALTWNLFAGLLYYKKLHKVYNQLTEENTTSNQLDLFLWGLKIDFNDQEIKPWHQLLEVREILEPRREVRNYPTEPDIMILGPTHLVCIEAKFMSGNPVVLNGKDVKGKKPNSWDGLIERYITRNKIWNPPAIKSEELKGKVHSQLLRMLVFTSTMAQLEKRKWIVANLISNTQWKKKKNKKSYGYDFNDPTSSIPASVRNNFKFISWEHDIYEEILKNDPALIELSNYMKNKTANLGKAFEI